MRKLWLSFKGTIPFNSKALQPAWHHLKINFIFF
ncbi:hypothetical protein CLV24_10456 [Pontibacter ummariensis]|uniref:Uncharacterized protein n=1 Tax=Pontibacter ummariensis TaxID=1610492 RepID=A0A239D5M2_9BACT|nr:hypothetical protein CLV24_10456 [Pontibacter ummariensis]SNS27298.1 hypothetical protein SAMN06296052_10455 [Pontibacter ummariensis]